MASYSSEKKPELLAAVELSELSELVETLPETYRESFENALGRAARNIERRRRILNFIQEALSQLRLDMKYLMFDLDATRRERDDYRQQLEESSH